MIEPKLTEKMGKQNVKKAVTKSSAFTSFQFKPAVMKTLFLKIGFRSFLIHLKQAYKFQAV